MFSSLSPLWPSMAIPNHEGNLGGFDVFFFNPGGGFCQTRVEIAANCVNNM